MESKKDEITLITELKLHDDDLELVFSEKGKVNPPDADVDVYRFKMISRISGEIMGDINIKAGYTENIVKYRGNIGFTVHENFRGHHYSARSCLLLIPVIKILGLNTLYITCNTDNYASRKNIELLGAEFVEEIAIAADSAYAAFYTEDSRHKLRYVWQVRQP